MSLGLWAGDQVTYQPTQVQARQPTQPVCMDEHFSSVLWGGGTVTPVDRSRGGGVNMVGGSVLYLQVPRPLRRCTRYGIFFQVKDLLKLHIISNHQIRRESLWVHLCLTQAGAPF